MSNSRFQLEIRELLTIFRATFFDVKHPNSNHLATSESIRNLGKPGQLGVQTRVFLRAQHCCGEPLPDPRVGVVGPGLAREGAERARAEPGPTTPT